MYTVHLSESLVSANFISTLKFADFSESAVHTMNATKHAIHELLRWKKADENLFIPRIIHYYNLLIALNIDQKHCVTIVLEVSYIIFVYVKL